MTDLIPLSASQIKAYDDGDGGGCPTAWAGTYLGKLPRSESGGTNAGSKVHGVLERYLRDGTGIASGETYTYDGKVYYIGKAALAIAKHLPPAGSVPAEHVEKQFLITVANGAKRYLFRGGIDLHRPPCLGGAVYADVYDHKSCRGLGYVPTVKKLSRDVQVAMYAIVDLAHRDGTDTYTIGQGNPTDVVQCQWTYGSTDGSGGRPVRFSVTRAQAEVVFLEKILPVADKIYAAYLAAAPWATHEKNLSACSAYGGCARLKDKTCTPSVTQRGLRMLSRDELMARINAKKAGAPAEPVKTAAEMDAAAGSETVAGTTDAPPMSRLERIRAQARMINRPDAAAVTAPVVHVTTPAGTVTVTASETDTAQDLADKVNDAAGTAVAAPIADAPKRRGRPRKVVEASPSVVGPDGAGHATGTQPPLTVMYDADLLPGADPGDGGVDPSPTGYVLYVDCRPTRATVTYAHDLIAKASATVRDDAGVPDVGLIDFGKGYPGLAAQLRQDLIDAPVSGAIVTSTYTPEGRATLQVLMEGASEIVLGR